MTSAVFYKQNDRICAFSVSGHTDNTGSVNARLVCAAVSSAVYMAVNTVTDVIGDKAEVSLDDGRLDFRLTGLDRSQSVLNGLLIHLQGLKEQYPEFIRIKMEVQHDA